MISISGAVGKGCINHFKDVATVQTLLNDNIFQMVPYGLLDVDGKFGPATSQLVTHFQRRVLGMRLPDGQVDPNGGTLRRLAQNARPEPAPPTSTSTWHLDFPGPVLQKLAIRFPFDQRPVESYKQGMRRFGSNRSGGRKHAGCDLYAPVGTPIYAMADGTVLQDMYSFYLGTFALEVQHPDFVARYGEIKGVADGLKKGSQVKRGQVIAYVGLLQKINMNMLHLELYSGEVSGALTDRNNPPYKRRKDLIDPTPILDAAVLK